MRTKAAQRLLWIMLLVSGCGDLQTLSLGSDLNRRRPTQNTARDAGESDRDSAAPDAEVEDHEHEDEPRQEDGEHDEQP